MTPPAPFHATLQALAGAADPRDGFFGPDSLSWRINGEALLLLGGMRALLMQVAHPKVAQGVADHSRFRQAPLARALRTFRAVHGIVFGDTGEAVAHALAVRAIHQRVRGRLRPPLPAFAVQDYCASDPDLLLWVFATLMDSAVVSYEAFFTPLTPGERERFYQEGKRFAQLFGLRESELPADWAGFRGWLRDRLDGPEIVVSDNARAIADALLGGTFWLRAIGPVNALLAAGALDERLRAAYGLRWSPTRRRAFAALVGSIRLLGRITPRPLRQLPAARRARRRCRAARPV